jgi:hypothetical protein
MGDLQQGTMGNDHGQRPWATTMGNLHALWIYTKEKVAALIRNYPFVEQHSLPNPWSWGTQRSVNQEHGPDRNDLVNCDQ